MLRTRCHFALPFFVLSCVLLSTNEVLCQSGHEQFYKLVRTVHDVLDGKTMAEAKVFVSPKAGLIYGSRFENLSAAVAGEVKGVSLADTSYHGVMLQAATNSSEDAGFIVLKTRKSDTTQVRFHTVVFMKDSTGQYKINLWHVGGI